MKRRGFFGAALAGVVGTVVAVKGQGAQVPEETPESLRELLKEKRLAEVEEQLQAALRDLRIGYKPPMWITQLPPPPPEPITMWSYTTTSGANTNPTRFVFRPDPNLVYAEAGSITLGNGTTVPIVPLAPMNNHGVFLPNWDALLNPPTIITTYPNGDGPV